MFLIIIVLCRVVLIIVILYFICVELICDFRAPSKVRASDRQTKSQQEALQRLKDKQSMHQIGGGAGKGASSRYDNNNKHLQSPAPTRKVVNYARQQDFPHI